MSIQKMRLKRGWSQQQLADASGLNVRTVQRIEAGHPGSIESIKSIAAVFEVDFSTLSSEAIMVDKQNGTDAIRERMAFMRVRRIRGFYMHLMLYLIVTAGCALIDFFTSPGVLWFVGLALFWGLAVLVHALTVFVFERFFGGPWELDQVEKLLGRPL
ncbi:helix-turn-helix domain-containing protein [Massilia sp. 9I]|uniref:helix-turn-helix domain-containing protein n=1 Tax=Massilia sp. 9I TaxID=2653152 RepID=UPI0012EF88A6|nr:helix-turn-helix domain-containing protein [Massilia sp. 9I]VXB18808.1 Helix-turn-helix domain-containing protein [Massilia sp. 9I]